MRKSVGRSWSGTIRTQAHAVFRTLKHETGTWYAYVVYEVDQAETSLPHEIKRSASTATSVRSPLQAGWFIRGERGVP